MAQSAKKHRAKRVPYAQAADDDKVARNWKKTLGLYERGEYSVAVLRCGTCIELAVNFAVRQELVVERELPLPFVDKLLLSSNGLRNKYHNIYLPIMAEYQEHEVLKKLWNTHIEKINRERNAVAHSGEFRKESVASDILEKAHHVLVTIMDLHEHDAEFPELEP